MSEPTKVTDKSKDEISAQTQSTVEREERELASRLRSAIDRTGRYSYRLDDMAAGFAAGRGVSPSEARKKIEHQFSATYSCSPKEYMDQRFQEKQHGRE